jgi:hypothetical protein
MVRVVRPTDQRIHEKPLDIRLNNGACYPSGRLRDKTGSKRLLAAVHQAAEDPSLLVPPTAGDAASSKDGDASSFRRTEQPLVNGCSIKHESAPSLPERKTASVEFFGAPCGEKGVERTIR